MTSKKEFLWILSNTPIRDIDKESIRFALGYYNKNHHPKLTSRSFLLLGSPGLGKTFLAKKLKILT